MSEADESSYYEIALTNRQVLGGFVILLACMLAAFFSGVWVGRGGAVGAQPTTEVAEENPDAGLQSFRFFDQEKDPNLQEIPEGRQPQAGPSGQQPQAGPSGQRPQPGQAAQAVPSGNPQTTLAQDVGASPSPSAETVPPSEPVADPPPRRASPPPPPPQVAERPAATGAAAETVPRATARRPDEAPQAGELFVQVFSTHDEEQARKVLRRMLDSNLKAFISPAPVGNKTAYRVRIGPFEDREAAERVARQVQQTHKLETWITSQ